MTCAGFAGVMFGEARPVCPVCGASLFARPDGELACHQHGAWYPAKALDAAFGDGTAASARTKADRAPPVGRKCPDDRLALGTFASPSGRVKVEGCARCGGIWLPAAVLEDVARATPAPKAATPQEARALLGWAAVRGVLLAPPTR